MEQWKKIKRSLDTHKRLGGRTFFRGVKSRSTKVFKGASQSNLTHHGTESKPTLKAYAARSPSYARSYATTDIYSGRRGGRKHAGIWILQAPKSSMKKIGATYAKKPTHVSAQEMGLQPRLWKKKAFIRLNDYKNERRNQYRYMKSEWLHRRIAKELSGRARESRKKWLMRKKARKGR